VDVGERVNHLRVALGISKPQLASRAGVRAGRLDLIEAGQWEPNIRERVGLARALAVTEAYLMTGAGAQAIACDLLERPTFRAFALQLEKLPPKRQDALLVLFAEAVRAALAGKEPTL
jgi:transcriptional regulator with XRE-family HTH domain